MADSPSPQATKPKEDTLDIEALFGSEAVSKIRRPSVQMPEQTQEAAAPPQGGGLDIEALFGSEAISKIRTPRGDAALAPETAQLPLPIETKEPPKAPPEFSSGIPASKRDIAVPAYVRKHLDVVDGEPVIYLTQAPNQKTGVKFLLLLGDDAKVNRRINRRIESEFSDCPATSLLF